MGLKEYYEEELFNFITVENSPTDVTIFADEKQESQILDFITYLIETDWEVGQASDTDGNLFFTCSQDNDNFTIFTKIKG
jgi:hypothetical protein